MMLQPLHQNAFILRRPKVANFADMIKIPTKKVNRIGNYVLKCNLLYCMKISRHENFTVSRSSSKNREFKMPRKLHFELNREIKMPQKKF